MKRALVLLALSAFIGPAWAGTWVNQFDNFSGSDGTAVSNYTDTNGLNPRSYGMWSTSSNWSALPAGWLTQGTIEGSNKTAKFANPADSLSGRARFGTALPASMDADGGVAVAWRMRVGAANPTRGPIQICVTSDGATHLSSADNPLTNSAFVRVRNNGGAGGTQIDILRNNGNLYANATAPYKINTLTLGSNLADEWHQWTASVIRDPATNHGYWKLWLDGTLLAFTGDSGSPMYDPDGAGPEASQAFSFATLLHEGFGGTVNNEPYVGLGDLNTQDVWDFEFDYVNYQDDGIGFFVPEPASLMLFAAGSLLITRKRRS